VRQHRGRMQLKQRRGCPRVCRPERARWSAETRRVAHMASKTGNISIERNSSTAVPPAGFG
jgi:hypothetical protein